MPAPTTSSKLFPMRKASREQAENVTDVLTDPARHAKSRNETPITMTRKTRMNMPRAGSDANACTLVSTPERTRKVPRSESENVRIARNTVQTLNAPRFSVTASECIRAVPVSQGMSEEFSTGSQAHQPPQPSS